MRNSKLGCCVGFLVTTIIRVYFCIFIAPVKEISRKSQISKKINMYRMIESDYKKRRHDKRLEDMRIMSAEVGT